MSDDDETPTYWNGEPIHGPTTHEAGTEERKIGVWVDATLPGSYYADKELGLNEPIDLGFYQGTPGDEIAVVGFWLVVIIVFAIMAWGDYEALTE